MTQLHLQSFRFVLVGLVSNFMLFVLYQSIALETQQGHL
jgi:hypothetical protein